MRILILLVSLSFALPVMAQVPTGTSDYLARMDSDHDGRVSIDEYVSWMTYAFDERDADHNGVLEGAELPGSRGKPIARTTLVAQLRQRFAKQDRNHDGFLDAKELASPPQ
ncbi:EF hand [Pseudoxanthomonas sp. GM95]|nr:EF hand [Pseudoxanthomonas sp. GM95]